MATNPEVLARWVTEAGREDPHYLHRGSTVFVTKEDGVLFYDPTGRGRRNARRSEILASFHGHHFDRRGFALLNGDGFQDQEATAWQTRVREHCQARFTWPRCPIIPFQALDGAGVDRETIKLIHVTQETHDEEIHNLPANLNPVVRFPNPSEAEALGFRRTDAETHNANAREQVWEGTLQNFRLRVSFVQDRYDPHNWRRTFWLWAQPAFGAPGWQHLQHTTNEVVEGQSVAVYGWTEAIHRLGAVVFVASYQGSTARHRFVSAFDMQEAGGLYFLAQLPAKGQCSSFEDALSLLAPPIVHRANEEGKAVFRQGDVFAIEIDRDDDWVYEDALHVVRRKVVLADHQDFRIRGRIPPAPKDHEVKERGTCPFCHCRPMVGNGAIARRALMIHGTAHTADEVVVKQDGRTFIRGTMYHDPALETPGRMPEHTPRPLNAPSKVDCWFLAVRNTVPRIRNTPMSVTEPADETQPGRQALENNRQHEAQRQQAAVA